VARTSTLVLVCLGLLALLALTVAASFTAWEPAAKTAANLTIAFAKAALISWFFMHLRGGSGRLRLFAYGVLLWLAVMFTLGFADWVTRGA
jgi:cytochrome c oxidase subunit 4